MFSPSFTRQAVIGQAERFLSASHEQLSRLSATRSASDSGGGGWGNCDSGAKGWEDIEILFAMRGVTSLAIISDRCLACLPLRKRSLTLPPRLPEPWRSELRVLTENIGAWTSDRARLDDRSYGREPSAIAPTQ